MEVKAYSDVKIEVRSKQVMSISNSMVIALQRLIYSCYIFLTSDMEVEIKTEIDVKMEVRSS